MRPTANRLRMDTKPLSVFFASVALCAAGCGDGAKGEIEVDGPLGSITQAWGEDTCRDALPDFANSTIAWESFTSPTATYDHPNCRNTYIGSKAIKNPLLATTLPNEAVSYLHAKYAGPVVPPSWGCNGMWVKIAYMYGPNVNPNSSLLGQHTVFGQEFEGRCLPPQAAIDTVVMLQDLFLNQAARSGFPRIFAQAGYGPSYQAVGIEWSWDSNLNIHDGSRNPHGETWAFGYKARCSDNQSIIGVSRASSGRVKNVLCRLDPRVGTAYSNRVVLDFTNSDDRRDPLREDWAPGFVKGECPRGWGMTGLAQSESGRIQGALCMRLGSLTATDLCSVQNFENADSRSSLKFDEWSPSAKKGQCQDGDVVKGISRGTDGRARSILCCRDPGIR